VKSIEVDRRCREGCKCLVVTYKDGLGLSRRMAERMRDCVGGGESPCIHDGETAHSNGYGMDLLYSVIQTFGSRLDTWMLYWCDAENKAVMTV
jgi:hypothetical protein